MAAAQRVRPGNSGALSPPRRGAVPQGGAAAGRRCAVPATAPASSGAGVCQAMNAQWVHGASVAHGRKSDRPCLCLWHTPPAGKEPTLSGRSATRCSAAMSERRQSMSRGEADSLECEACCVERSCDPRGCVWKGACSAHIESDVGRIDANRTVESEARRCG